MNRFQESNPDWKTPTENPDTIKGSARRRVKEKENIAQTKGIS